MNLPVAKELRLVRDGVMVWEAFSPHHKVELSSSAVVIEGQTYVFDPIPLAEDALCALEKRGFPRAILLTNENHLRHAEVLQQRWMVPIVASEGARISGASISRLAPGQDSFDEFQVIHLSGGAGGELAFFHAGKRLLVLGDAVFNLPVHGFNVLLDRYCENRPLLINRLKSLVALDFDLLLMAHGKPIEGNPREQIHELLHGVAA